MTVSSWTIFLDVSVHWTVTLRSAPHKSGIMMAKQRVWSISHYKCWSEAHSSLPKVNYMYSTSLLACWNDDIIRRCRRTQCDEEKLEARTPLLRVSRMWVLMSPLAIDENTGSLCWPWMKTLVRWSWFLHASSCSSKACCFHLKHIRWSSIGNRACKIISEVQNPMGKLKSQFLASNN